MRWIAGDGEPVEVRRRLLLATIVVLIAAHAVLGQAYYHRGAVEDAYAAGGLAGLLGLLGILLWRRPSAQYFCACSLSAILGGAFAIRVAYGVSISFYDGQLAGRLPALAAFVPLVILLTFMHLERHHAMTASSGIALAVAVPIGFYVAFSPHPSVVRHQLHLLDGYVIAPAASVLVAALYAQIKELFEETSAARRTAEAAADRDPLTQAYNRRGFERLAQNAHDGYCVAIVDIDHFKKVNDERGHAAGDEILKRVAETIGNGVRSSDLVGRWGGEEFIIRFGFCDTLSRGLRAAEKLRGLIELETTVTVSIGVALGTGRELETVFNEADQALYGAKGSGRNRVAAWDPEAARVDTCPAIPAPQTVDLVIS